MFFAINTGNQELFDILVDHKADMDIVDEVCTEYWLVRVNILGETTTLYLCITCCMEHFICV